MDKLNDTMLFPKAIRQKQLEKVHYIELEKYSKKVYKRDIISNLIVLTIIVVAVGAVTLCMMF